MKVADFPPVVREALAVHELFRRLGFRSEDIYIEFYDKLKEVAVLLKAQGTDFRVFIGGSAPYTHEQFRALWLKSIAAVNAMSDEEAAPIWEGSKVRNECIQIAERLLAKGLVPPRFLN